MIAGVNLLESICFFPDSHHYGNKALSLSYMLSNRLTADYILPGFCVTFDMRREIRTQMEELAADISQLYYEKLKGRYKTVIVRSSADREDGENVFFPGIFKSFSGVSDLSSLYEAICQCVESAFSKDNKLYTQEHDLSYHIDYFTVLVQGELDSDFAGIAFSKIPMSSFTNDDMTMIVQFAPGNNHEMVKGLGSFNTYSMFCSDAHLNCNCIQQMIPIDTSLVESVLQLLYDAMIQIKKLIGSHQDVEWGYADGKLYIFQARCINAKGIDQYENRIVHAFPSDPSQGLKYQAMSFFVENGLFPHKAFLFPKKTSTNEIGAIICREAEDAPITIRFSNQSDIGLPRLFLTSPSMCYPIMQKVRQKNWSVIAYNSLEIKGSYEMYMDLEKTILEYVPGMWESDSHLLADSVLIMNDEFHFYLAKKKRKAKYENAFGICIKDEEPTKQESAKQFVMDFLPTIEKLRGLLINDLPLNFHFISDGAKLYFLNCRLSPSIEWIHRDEKSLFIIEKLTDCDAWDGSSAILFKPKLIRGEELNLLEFVPFLKFANAPVYVDFGMLSHPAILLREFGVTVLPHFSTHDYFTLSRNE